MNFIKGALNGIGAIIAYVVLCVVGIGVVIAAGYILWLVSKFWSAN